MKHLRRLVGLAVTALAMFVMLAPNAATPSYVTYAYAQDANTVTIDGSNIVSPILKLAVQNYTAKTPDAKLQVNVSGTDGGFDKLCSGTLDINMASKPITDQQIAACKANNIDFVELLLGYDALVAIANNSVNVTCVNVDQLYKLLGPTGTSIKNWNVIDPAFADLAIEKIYSPNETAQAYVLADSLVPGEGLRTDLQKVDPPAKVVESVSGDTKGVGFMSLSDYDASVSPNVAVHGLQLKVGTTCLEPTIANLEEARYPAAETLYLYVNPKSLDRKPVSDFLTYVFSTEGRAAVKTSGFVQASDNSYTRAQNYLTSKNVGRTFSRVQNINVPADTAGAITLDGAAAAFPILNAIKDAFTPRYAKITVNATTYGNESGYRRLCAGTVDIIGATRLPTEAESAECQKANIAPLRLQVGTQGVVVVINGNNTFAQCLTTEQIGKLFGIASDGKVKKWSDVNDSFPGTDLLLLTPDDGKWETDFLLGQTVKGQVSPLQRRDVVTNGDALYRAAGTQNVEGAVTYMTFADFQKVKSNVKAVSVNAGSGCVEPTEANMKNGSYPLAQPLYLLLNPNAFARPEMKAFVWFLLSDDALAAISGLGLTGTDNAAFISARDIALERFSQTAGAASATLEATAGATVEATANATPNATAEAPANATQTAVTPAATVNATAAATTAQ
jgi:phosphate transport system substrate-binding protein